MRTSELSSNCDDLDSHCDVNCLFYAYIYDEFISSISQHYLISYGQWRDFFQRFFSTSENIPDQEVKISMLSKNSCNLLFHEENKCSREISVKTSLEKPQTLLTEEELSVRNIFISNDTCTHDIKQSQKHWEIQNNVSDMLNSAD